MKKLLSASLLAVIFLNSCDHIDAVGGKVNDLKNLREESTSEALVNGIRNDGVAVRDIGGGDFQSFISAPGKLNVVDFHADWCGPCRKLGPVLSAVIEANSGVARLGKVNVDQARRLSQEQGVRSIPDVRFYIDGKLVHKFIGGESRATIERLVAIHSAGIKQPVGKSAGTGVAGTGPDRPRAVEAKPLGEAMRPMSKEWLPPGVRRK